MPGYKRYYKILRHLKNTYFKRDKNINTCLKKERSAQIKNAILMCLVRAYKTSRCKLNIIKVHRIHTYTLINLGGINHQQNA